MKYACDVTVVAHPTPPPLLQARMRKVRPPKKPKPQKQHRICAISIYPPCNGKRPVWSLAVKSCRVKASASGACCYSRGRYSWFHFVSQVTHPSFPTNVYTKAHDFHTQEPPCTSARSSRRWFYLFDIPTHTATFCVLKNTLANFYFRESRTFSCLI